MDWTDERCEELDTLQSLLTEAAALNSGSNVVRRIGECERLSKALFMTDLSNGRPSFIQFLNKLAIKERAK